MSATESGAPRIDSSSLHGLVDPFSSESSKTSTMRRSSQRYSAFDDQLFSQNQSTASPGQAKRALEAHLNETERRLEETSKLGTALVQQRKDLSQRLKDVEAQQGEQEIGPELKQKLLEVEKEFNELGRDSARAFLAPKTQQHGGPLSEVRVSNWEQTYGINTNLGQNPASPTKYSSQATDSPSKVSVPSRKQRNQPSNRVHDIEFATEISTSLLGQVRQLQGALAERDDSLRKLQHEKSQIEVDHQGLTQRLRNLDESEQRYKDENWNLETKTHELMAAAKESATREQKLQQSLSAVTNEKTSAQRELDDVKQAHGKLMEDHAALRKSHETDVAGMKKSATLADSNRDTLQRRIDELTAQNHALANGLATGLKGEEYEPASGTTPEPDDFSLDKSDLEHSPPPSPSKGGARNSMLESETLKSSLSHAHRMIQTLKSNVHREKSEKMELKRLLQETRDELEVRRAESGATNKRAKTKALPDPGKKHGKLGAGRSERTEYEIEDADWEDHQGRPQSNALLSTMASEGNATSDLSENYQTADETEDAYETAEEKNTESEAFHTGAEDAAHSSDELTETEGSTRNTVRSFKQPAPSTDKRASYLSTASTTDNDGGRESPQQKTPVQGTLGSIKNRFRLSRGSRRSRVISDNAEGTPRSSKDSPASFRGPKGQTLAAELGDFDNESIGDSLQGTPSRNTTVSRHSTPGRNTAIFSSEPPVPKIPMVDAGVMTEEPEPEPVPEPVPVVAPPKPQLVLSDIQTIETTPPPLPEVEGTDGMKEAASAGMIGSVFGWAIGKRQSTPSGVGDEATRELSEISPNQVQSMDWSDKQAMNLTDQSSQTVLSAEQIDNLLAAKEYKPPGAVGSIAPVPIAKPSTPTKESAAGPKPALSRDAVLPARGGRRPGSSSSTRAYFAEAPPLPSDHREAIAAAASTRESTQGSMGPPPLPSSAYRSTPRKAVPQAISAESTPYGPARAGVSAPPQGTPTTPRHRYSTTRSTRSRRSSVSSFESELDARFNIRPDGTPVAQNFEGGADPRMIQAITQTMIGEFLWKYTRKAGRGDMSAKRHQRFFWIHPYTRTLYWSDRDPSTAGRAQLKAKSVAIEAVRVITDDNPMPPGLHRKSIMVITPGRDIKFTATTGQRHETWFNALSYLLLRSGPEPMHATTGGDGTGLTADDVAEFNPSLLNRQSTASRASLSTYNSRPDTMRNSRLSSRNESPIRERHPGTSYNTTGPFGTVVRRTVPGQQQQQPQQQQQSQQQQQQQPTLHPSQVGTATSRASESSSAQHAGIGSRLSTILRPNRSTSTQNGRAQRDASGASANGGIYDARVVHDSAEDVRQVLAKQDEDADRLENVRACCDGKSLLYLTLVKWT
jgi:Meiotic cell cortex C-terminal pleckstrin homology